MGIFGFLSKAHLEQNLASDTLVQRIQILEDKISSEKMSIERQTLVINRAENAINRDTGTASGDIEVQQSIIKDANEKLKTLLAVETNTVRDLNDRLKVLDKNVSDVLTSNKSFFNEEKAAAELKASQKDERKQIALKVKEAHERIAELKADHKVEIAKAQEIIANMRSGSQDNKGQFTKEIEVAEQKIFDSQGRIDFLIVEKQPLEKEMLTLEAEIGPVKYIAALAVDWGITDQVETSKAVRWVILLLIVVFDPLAVLLLIAANQSLMRRFPPEPPKPQEVIDLEKPDEEGIDLKWNAMMDKSNAAVKMEEATEQLKGWKAKLDRFNAQVPKQEDKPVEFIHDDDSIPHVELKGQKKTEVKEIVADFKDAFDPDEVMFDMETVPKVDKDKQLEEFKKREEEENKALEEYARKAREDEPTISQQIEEVMEPERTRPDFTEVIEPEQAVQDMMEDPIKALEEDLRIEKGTAKKTLEADMSKLAIEPEIGEFTGGYKPTFVKKSQDKINKDAYVQNAEQNDTTGWKKIKAKTTTEEDYHQRMEQRIEDLMAKLDAGEIKMEDLTAEDRQVIIDIRMQNESGDNLK